MIQQTSFLDNPRALSHAQEFVNIVEQLCSGQLDKHQSNSSVRMRLMLRIIQCLEDLVPYAKELISSTNDAHAHIAQSVVLCRRSIEDSRVQLHPELSASVMDAECALTEDTGYFMAVALCDRFILQCGQLRESLIGDNVWACFNTGEGVSADYPYYLWQNIPVSVLTPIQLDDAFATLFTHAREIDWEIVVNSALGGLICALHLRASQILTDHVYEMISCELYYDRRALWSCAVARLKLFALQSMQYRTHQRLRCKNAVTTVKCGKYDDVTCAPTPTTAACMVAYMTKAVIAWNGPRLREAVSKAQMRRILRPDEVGRNAAFEGSNPYCRARGTTDAVEDALHKLDFVTLLQTPAIRCVGVLKLIRDLLMLKLFHNALEAIAICDFMHNHVQLQSLRDCRDMSQANISLYVHRIWELPSGYVVTPHSACYPTHALSLEAAISIWYDTQFKASDPLGLHL
jgi:hypothetical protein